MNDKIDDFLASVGNKPTPPADQPCDWDRIIQPKSSHLILGDVGTGKSALAYWLLERYGAIYNLTPTTVGIPPNKRELLPPHFRHLEAPDDLTKQEHVIAFIDEADLQLPIEDVKAREYVINFLMMYRQRDMIMLLGFHYPRLVLARYLPSFSTFLLKRPPYLIEFASKRKGDAIALMMQKAEERFAELVPPDWVKGEAPPAVVSHTYVVAPRLRWQGMLQNPVPSFWSNDLSEIWAGIHREPQQPGTKQLKLERESEETTAERLGREVGALFPGGLTDEVLDTLIQFDRNYSLEQLQEMCRAEGLPIGGHKKLLAARLVAKKGPLDLGSGEGLG